MKLSVYVFLILGFTVRVQAELLSVPEDCFVKQVSPCLMKASENERLVSPTKSFSLSVDENTILKITSFTPPYQVELMQGKFVFESIQKKTIAFKIDEIPFESIKVFAKLEESRKLSVYDTRNFIWSQYALPSNPKDEAVLARSEFLAKLDMIQFLASFYSSKNALSVYLKSIESRWKKEFAAQTEDQTLTLQRSIASVEQEEAEKKRKEAEEAAELKKVRERFFYRTFYR